MASTVCDRAPCQELQMAISALVVSDSSKTTFSLLVVPRLVRTVQMLVPLKYCPFCGTRIEEDWVRDLSPVKERRMLGCRT